MPLRSESDRMEIVRRWQAGFAHWAGLGRSAAFVHAGQARRRFALSALSVVGLSSVWAPVVYAQQRPVYRPLTDFLRIEAAQVIVGDENARGPALFGDIHGVTVDGQGNLYVLDFSDRSVRAFSRTGQHLGSAGRQGRGPGDLISPLTIWHDGREFLYIVDQIDGVSRFRTGAGAPRYDTRFAAELQPKSICGIGGQLYVGAVTESGIVHAITTDGRILRSFGGRFRSDSIPGVQEALNMSQLKLACDEQAGRIFVAEGANSRVRGYEAGGRLLWESKLPEYDGTTAGVNRNPRGIAFFYGSHQTRTVTRIGRNLLVVQARHVSRRRNPANPMALLTTDHDIVTWVLSAATGQVLTRQGGAPFLSLSRGDLTVGYVGEPLPQVMLMRVEPRR
ncbi:MAG: hypothetical protein ABR551_12865 [Gemmatimonadales bacterium]